MWVPLPLALLLLFTGTTAQLDSQERLPVTVGVYGEGWERGASCSAAPAAAEPPVQGVLATHGVTGKSRPAGWNKPHFWTDAGGGNYTGFVAEVLDWVCDRGSLECSEVPIDSLDDMIPSVKNVSLALI